jgi:hypothetical protein
MTTPSHVEVNLALCRMLGIEDASNVQHVEVAIDPVAYPLVRVTRQIRTSEGWKATTQKFDLVPHDAP